MTDLEYLYNCLWKCTDPGEFSRITVHEEFLSMRYIFAFDKTRDNGRRYRYCVNVDIYAQRISIESIPDLAQHIVNQARIEFIKSNTQEITTNPRKEH